MCFSIIGSALSAGGSLIQGQQQAAVYKQNAKALDAEAKQREREGYGAEERQVIQDRGLSSTARVAALKNGVTLTGSTQDILAQSAADAAIDRLAIRYQTKTTTNALKSQATAQRYAAKAAKRSGIFSAATTLLGGALSEGQSYYGDILAKQRQDDLLQSLRGS